MGVRGELFSTKVSLQNRTYFFNVKENRLGDLYLNIVESKNKDEGGFERQSVILFAEDLQEFLKGFDESLRVLEKSLRDKRRGTKSAPNDRFPPSSRGASAPRRSPHSGPRAEGPTRRRDEPRDNRFGESSYGRRREEPRDNRFGESSYGRRREEPRDNRFGESSYSRRREEPRGSRFNERPERKSERPGRPPREQKDFSPQKKRVVVRKGTKHRD